MTDSYSIEYTHKLNGESRWIIQCECDRELPMDTMTECDKCGAHYEVNLEQVAPPVPEVE